MKISIIGLGYVGVSCALLFCKKHSVIGVDIDQEKIDLINRGIYPIKDERLSKMLSKRWTNFLAVSKSNSSYLTSDLFIIALPTDYSKSSNGLNTTLIGEYAKKILSVNKEAIIIIKSTVPVGYTNGLNANLKTDRILFSPEFLREDSPLYDTFFPNKVIISSTSPILGEKVLKIFQDLLQCTRTSFFMMNPIEAEATKLFSNVYLSMRVVFFNELDTFSEIKGLDTSEIIKAMELEPRIGRGYNNPSFGYGGYCLPKDTLELADSVKGFNNLELIKGSIHEANELRKKHITSMILKQLKDIRSVGIYRLIMKENSENFRNSSILSIINNLLNEGVEVSIYEPLLNKDDSLSGLIDRCIIETDLEKFKNNSKLIIANRIDKDIKDVVYKVYTRDIFNIN